MKLTKAEQETIVLYDERDKTATIYTHNIKLKNRLEKYASKCPDCAWLIRYDGQGGVTYEVIKRRMSIQFTAPPSEERRRSSLLQLLKNSGKT